MSRIFICCLVTTLCSINVYAENTRVWSGQVSSNGTPSESIPLETGKKYQIRASGSVNLNKWRQAGQPLGEDANYSYVASSTSEDVNATKGETLKNSLSIPLGDGTYHPDHIYSSQPFVAKENRIHFWVYDIDYDDNAGSFDVEIYKINP